MVDDGDWTKEEHILNTGWFVPGWSFDHTFTKAVSPSHFSEGLMIRVSSVSATQIHQGGWLAGWLAGWLLSRCDAVQCSPGGLRDSRMCGDHHMRSNGDNGGGDGDGGWSVSIVVGDFFA
jgi:hypothetical protein